MEYVFIWIAFATIQAMAVISPGPAFALTVRNAVAHHRTAGLMIALGLGMGVAVHAIISLTGLTVIITEFPPLFYAIKYAGALYLIYLGLKGIRAKKSKKTIDITPAKTPDKALYKFFITGFLTNILNPKAWIIIPAIFIQFLTPETPLMLMIAFGITMPVLEALWFSFLTVFLTHEKTRAKFLSMSHWIERICGGLLIMLGIKILFDKSLKIT